MDSRYKAQIAIPEIGLPGQKKLSNASVLIIGMGGLGCPIALQLVTAGIGTVGLMDADIISESNLARQILYSEKDIGESKIQTANEYLKRMNSQVRIVLHDCFLNKKNCAEILPNYDVIVDASDNFSTRYLLNDACFLLKKPLVSGMVFRFEGRLLYFDFRNKAAPCLRCLHPSFDNQVQSCSMGGVTNMITGMIGSLQANEVLKFIIGIDQNDETFLLKYDSIKNEMKKIRLIRDLDCQLCSEKSSTFNVEKISMNLNYDTKKEDNSNISDGSLICDMEEFRAIQQSNKKIVILDVRNPEELIIDGEIPNNINIPMDFLERDSEMQLNQDDEIIIHCRSGIRSLYATQTLRTLGFTNVRSLEGGIMKYKASEII